MRPALPHLESVNLVGKTLVYYEILESLGDGGTRGGAPRMRIAWKWFDEVARRAPVEW